ncbi:hypothetical protein V8E36_003956 [Tilletia maclaganii]
MIGSVPHPRLRLFLLLLRLLPLLLLVFLPSLLLPGPPQARPFPPSLLSPVPPQSRLFLNLRSPPLPTPDSAAPILASGSALT